MRTLEWILLIIALISIACAAYFIYLHMKNKKAPRDNPYKSEVGPVQLDEFTTTTYLSQLQKMIQVYSVKYIESTLGEEFAMGMGINTKNIENKDILEAHKLIVADVLKAIHETNLDFYLTWAFGGQWLLDYIDQYTLSMVVNYTQHNIKEIAKIQ